MNKLKVLLGTKKLFQIFLSALWNLIFNLIFSQIPASEVTEDQSFASEDGTSLLCVRMLKQFFFKVWFISFTADIVHPDQKQKVNAAVV